MKALVYFVFGLNAGLLGFYMTKPKVSKGPIQIVLLNLVCLGVDVWSLSHQKVESTVIVGVISIVMAVSSWYYFSRKKKESAEEK